VIAEAELDFIDNANPRSRQLGLGLALVPRQEDVLAVRAGARQDWRLNIDLKLSCDEAQHAFLEFFVLRLREVDIDDLVKPFHTEAVELLLLRHRGALLEQAGRPRVKDLWNMPRRFFRFHQPIY